MWRLVGVEGPLKGQKFQLSETTVLGRAFDADIRLDDLTVSRHHAKIVATRKGYLVEDLSSGNGTFINGQLIGGATLLKKGDLIGLPNHVFRFAAQAEGETPETTVSVIDVPQVEDSAIMETLDVNATMLEEAQPKPGTEPAAVMKAHQRLRTVVEISNAMQTQLDLNKLLNEIMDSLFRLFPQVDRGFIMLKADDSDELTPKVARQRGRQQPEAITVSRRIINEAVDRRVAVLSADAMSDQRFAQAMSVMDFHIRSMMCAPLIANESLLGIIHLDTTRQDRRFTLDDLYLLTGVGNQIALAIANAKLHKRLLLRERMERDLQLARQVQESFLPDRPPEVPGMQFCAWYRAALQVGGDFYDFIPLAENRIAIVVGDVAGKGIPAALLMARLTSDLRFLALNENEPKDVLTRLNERLNAAGSEGSFVTLIFAVLDPAGLTLKMGNAAHPPALLRRKATGEVLRLLEGVNLPAGAIESEEFHQKAFRLEKGDVVCLYSDGVTEAMNARQELYGSERLRAVVAHPAKGPREVMDNVLRDVQDFAGDTPQSDDLTIVCLGAL